MQLRNLLEFDNIVIQCHDNPDADAIASGFGVYSYYKNQGKKVRFVYGGRFEIQKSNLVLMVSELNIPIEYVTEIEEPELLVTVDCQYGEGNVTHFPAKKVAVIDHHRVSGDLPPLSEVRSNLGACATVVRELLRNEGVDINEDKTLATALYYGLLTDTNNFTEISHPLDKDLRDDAQFDSALVTRFRNANLSLEEVEIAGSALMGYEYDDKHSFAIVKAKPCDPNILGIIGDMMREVDAVDTCLVYSVLPFGIKISIRSCVKEVKASELAEYITEGIGSGGGHLEKAGGFIQLDLLTDAQKNDIGTFLKSRLRDYFENSHIIYTNEYEVDLTDAQIYRKKKIPVGFVRTTDIFEAGTEISVRTLEGDLDIVAQDDVYIMIGIKGEVYPSKKEKFEMKYKVLEEPYVFDGEYAPTVKDLAEGQNFSLLPYARACVDSGESYIYVKQLDHRVKLFTEWDDKYMLGKVGDYLAVRREDYHDIYVIEKNIFRKTYERA